MHSTLTNALDLPDHPPDGIPCVPVTSVDKADCIIEHEELAKDPESQGHRAVYPEHRAEYLKGWPLAWAFVGWLMTEFMGGLVSDKSSHLVDLD